MSGQAGGCSDFHHPVQEQGTGNPGALLQQLQAAQASPRQQALLMRMLQESVLGAAAREPLAPRVLSSLPTPLRVFRLQMHQ